jgi:hypothetical protein
MPRSTAAGSSCRGNWRRPGDPGGGRAMPGLHGMRRCSRSAISLGMATVRKFIEPILHGDAAGVWNPDTLEWTGGPE